MMTFYHTNNGCQILVRPTLWDSLINLIRIRIKCKDKMEIGGTEILI